MTRRRGDSGTRRRKWARLGLPLVAVLIGAAAADAQQAARVPRVGFLRTGSPPDQYAEAFRQGLRERGYVEGQNILIEYHSSGSSSSCTRRPRRLPAVSGLREYAEDGILMAYGPSYPAMYKRTAMFVDKILKGARPADLPVEQPTRFGLVVNLRTAKALGITIPQSVLVRADEVIQ